MKQNFRFHVLGVPHTRTNLDYTHCAYTQKVFKFCKMMYRRGHTVYHYGVEGSNPECTENVTVVSNEIYDKVYGSTPKQGPYPFNGEDECYQTFYKNAIDEIFRRKMPLDIILPFWGYGTKPICDAHPDLITIEPGIGYTDVFSEYKIYESYAWLNCHLVPDARPSWYETVIPNYFDLDDFEFKDNYEERRRDPYFLYVGRVGECKGVSIAIDVCKELGIRLVIAGSLNDQFIDYEWPENVTYVGPVGVERRKELMSGAIASFMPSVYNEPFGGVQVENYLSGTPVISTDFGVFSETIQNGVNGYRCLTYDDFVRAALDCLDGKIRYSECRRIGEQYSLENIAPRYEKFFTDVINIYTDNGWYTLYDDTRRRLEALRGNCEH